MIKLNKHIEIVSSTMPLLSSMGLDSREAAQAVLARLYKDVRITIVNDLADLRALAARKPDIVFLGMKYLPVNPALGSHDPQRIWLSQYLDEHDITYTGSGQTAHMLELDKPSAKRQAALAGLNTTPFFVITKDTLPSDSDGLDYPLFVKPVDRGAGAGIDSQSVVHNYQQLISKTKQISSQLNADSLVEEYLPGREFSVALLKDEYSSDIDVLPLELIAPADSRGNRILSQATKSADKESYKKITDEKLKVKINALAAGIFSTLGARDYGRIDIRLDGEGNPQFLEANLLPSLLDGYGNFPKACRLNAGLSYPDMLHRIVNLALTRQTAGQTSQVKESVNLGLAVAAS